MYKATITSSVRFHAGRPTLFICSKPVPACAYITYFTHKNRYRDFADAGITLYSMPVFFATRGINALSGIPPFAEGIFENREPDFSVLDREVARILDACPNALIFPRINLSLPQWWDEENPDELCDTGFGGGPRRTCFSSDKWAAETKRMLKTVIDHISDSEYVDHIFGYQLAGGNTEEWFSFDRQGSEGIRSREKFRQLCQKDHLAGTESQYLQFLSDTVADRICEFASYTKELTDRKLIVGTFYGYTTTCVEYYQCHAALKRVLACPDIDFLCSPLSYDEARPAGRDHACQTVLDSLKLHGKLHFSENDTRTDLSGPPFDLPHYQTSVWYGPDLQTSLQIMKMHFARALCHGHAFWWFDMWGGWFHRPEYMDIVQKSAEIMAQAADRPLESCAKAAVFVDETAFCRMPKNDPTTKHVCHHSLKALGKTSVPYDIYLIDDFEAVKHRYRAFIFMVPVETPAAAAAMADCDAAGRARLVLDGTNWDITSEELRDFFRRAGVLPYFDHDAVVYENEGYLFIHACKPGVHHLPKGSFRDCFTGKTVSDPVTLSLHESILLEKTNDKVSI